MISSALFNCKIHPLFRVLTLVFVSATTASAQSPAYTFDQVERVAKLSELYGHIKFFHPYLGYKPINWDSAFAAAAPLVAKAKTDEETVTAIRQLLTVLNDEATTVQRTTKPAVTVKATPADSMQVYFTPDSTLVLKTNGYAGASDFEQDIEKLGMLASLLPKARAVLLDLRSNRPLSEYESGYFGYALNYTGFERLLSADPFPTAGVRLRNHSGFVPESGNTSGGYWSGYYTISGQTIQPRQTSKNRPLAILVNKDAALTPELFALRTRPHVQFYGTDTLSDTQLARTVSFPFSDSISVRFRTGELVNADGSIGLTGVQTIPAGNATEYVLDQLINPSPRPAVPTTGAAAPLPVTPPPPVYSPDKFPALGYRLLAGAKIWSIIHYFHAYKDLMPTDWNASLRTAIGELAAARDSMQYALAVAHFYRNIQDGHGSISGSVLPGYAGAGGLLIDIQFIDNKPVITHVYVDSVAAKGVGVGDVITSVNGEKIDARIARMSAIQPASNEWTRLHYVRNRLLRSPVGTPIHIGLLGADGRERTVSLISQPGSRLQAPPDTTATFRLLPGRIGYVDMGRLETRDVDRMFETFRDTKAVIFDTRNYPQGTAWAIAPRLTERKNVVAAQFFRYAPNEPDMATGESNASTQKYFFSQRIPPNEGKSVYKGKTVMLVDERTQSQAEHTGLFFEAANGTEFIGSPTAGANGDVTNFAIPGGISLSFSGHDVRHADGRPLQQVGLQPKIRVRPTIKGIRAGKDEVLDRAIQYLNTGK